MTASSLIARAARFSILLDKLPPLEVKTLDFPFGDVIDGFVNEMKVEMRDPEAYIPVPYRQLNRFFMAVCPTLTHGFEWNTDQRIRQSLVVGAMSVLPKEPVTIISNLPQPEHISRVIQVWGQHWVNGDSFKIWMQAVSATAIRDRLLNALKQLPETFSWKTLDAVKLLKQFESVSFDAIPSLLATLVHQKTSIINGQRITWRKVQEADGRLSLLSSPPHKASYTDDYDNVKEGFFAYKVVFSMETQAGNGQPWIFINVHVQRYADERLKDKNDGRDVSILMGVNQARLDDFPTDTTLVRLDTIGSVESGDWEDDLSHLLATIGARSLHKPEEIYRNPRSYWKQGEEGSDDEFYIVHAEGYKYGEDRGRGHALRTGYSFTEQGEVVAEILKHLTCLKPDDPLLSDKSAPIGIKTPLAMRDFDYLDTSPQLSKEQKENLGSEEAIQQELERRTTARRKERQPIIQKALERVLCGESISISILWHNADTRDALCEGLRNLFLLNSDENFPTNVTVIERFIPRDLLDKVDYNNGGFKKARQNKMKAWREFLRQNVPNNCVNRYALVELLSDSWKVYGAAREACAREGISSQMKRPVRVTRKEDSTKTISREQQAAINNSVRDLMLRQTGVLLGSPCEVYREAGILEDIVPNLDVLAFYLKQTQTNMMYPIATRLRPNGEVEVLLPHENSQWVPYCKAGPEMGRIFAETGSYYKDGKTWVKKDSALSLNSTKLLNFVTRVLTKELDGPTIALIEADIWRDKNKGKWEQLKNHNPFATNVLDFGQEKNPFGQPYQRTDQRVENLLAVIRIRSGDETPQYIPSANMWGVDKDLRDFQNLTGLIDTTVPGLLHYFSIGGMPTTAKGQDVKSNRHAYMMDGTGAGVAFKHQQMIEFMPFFVHPRFEETEMQKTLCRVPHYLRVSPAWTLGNITYPYPRHLAEQLIEDQLCIIGLDD